MGDWLPWFEPRINPHIRSRWCRTSHDSPLSEPRLGRILKDWVGLWRVLAFCGCTRWLSGVETNIPIILSVAYLYIARLGFQWLK